MNVEAVHVQNRKNAFPEWDESSWRPPMDLVDVGFQDFLHANNDAVKEM